MKHTNRMNTLEKYSVSRMETIKKHSIKNPLRLGLTRKSTTNVKGDFSLIVRMDELAID